MPPKPLKLQWDFCRPVAFPLGSGGGPAPTAAIAKPQPGLGDRQALLGLVLPESPVWPPGAVPPQSAGRCARADRPLDHRAHKPASRCSPNWTRAAVQPAPGRRRLPLLLSPSVRDGGERGAGSLQLIREASLSRDVCAPAAARCSSPPRWCGRCWKSGSPATAAASATRKRGLDGECS